jgi:putative RNA 2'-phosphotransferase
MAVDRVRLSKTMARALRHEPWVFELELDEQGWTPVEALLESLREMRGVWRDLTADHFAAVIAESDKQRYEMQDGNIRALYGHSIPAKIVKTPAVPPEILYHGTTDQALPIIMAQGLKPMKRQYVHFSVDEATARQVGKRKGGNTVILTILAGEAHRNGVPFYMGNEMIWLADVVAPGFIEKPLST